MAESVVNLQSHSNYNTIPPQIIDAEEPILGGIMLDPDAMERVVNILSPEMFFVSAHQEIYRACLVLHSEGGVTDFMTVMSWLYDHKLLDKVGGQNKIAQLIERTVSAVNIDRYAQLVRDKFIRRLFIQSGNELVALSLDQSYETDNLIDLTRKRLEKIVALQSDDKNESEYSQLMDKAERIILYEDNPGKRSWDLGKLAKQHGLSAKALEDIYFKHLVHKDSEPRYTWEELLQHEEDSQQWLMYGFLPRKSLTLLHGKAGDAKTRFLIGLLMKVAKGMDLKSEHGTFAVPKKGKVLIIQTDETKPETIETLQSYGMEIGLQVEFLLTWTVEEMPRLLRELKDYKPDAVLVDSLSSVSQYSCVEESDARYAKPILAMRAYAGRFNCWIGVIHHSNRDGQARGTTALEAAASTVMKIERVQGSPPSSGKRLISITKSRSRRPTTYLVEADWEQGEWTILEEATGWFSPESSIKDKIFNFLSEHPNIRYETREIAEILGLQPDSTRRAAYQMASDGLISKARKGNRNLYWVERDSGGGGSEPTPPPELEQECDRTEPETPGADLDMEPEPEPPEPEPMDQQLAADRIRAEDCKGLSIKQPSAQRFIQGLKRYDVRGRKTNYRGLVLIHSFQEYEKGFGMDRTLASVEYPTGKILAIAELTDCIEIKEAFLNEQPEEELWGGYWQPGRWAWKLENIRPVRPYPGAAGGSTVLWNPAIDHLEGVKIGDRVDNPTDDCWTGVRNCVAEITRHPKLREEILKLYPFLSDRQQAEVRRRLPVTDEAITDETITDETVTDEAITTPDIFDRIQVGDRLIRQDKVYIVINKSLSPKRVEITNRSDCTRRLFPCELEVLDFLHKPLKFGTTVRWGEYCGKLVQRCKNHKWYIKWQKRSDTWLERYGKPPSKALSPNEFEVIE